MYCISSKLEWIFHFDIILHFWNLNLIKKKKEEEKRNNKAGYTQSLLLFRYKYALLSLTVIIFHVILDISSLECWILSIYVRNIALYVSSFSFHSPVITHPSVCSSWQAHIPKQEYKNRINHKKRKERKTFIREEWNEIDLIRYHWTAIFTYLYFYYFQMK